MEKWKSDYLMGQLSSLGSHKKRYEMAVVVSLILNEKLLDVRPVLQFFVNRQKSNRKAYIDLYYPQLKLAIEIDEDYHDLIQPEDDNRQKEIEEELNCSFIRVDAKAEIFNIKTAISNLESEIIAKISEYKKSSEFEPWLEPPTVSLDTIKEQSVKTIIIKTVKDPQTGAQTIPYNRISQQIRENAEQIIVFSGSGQYHDALIGYTAFTANDFIQDPMRPGFVSPTGSTITDCSFLNSYIAHWDDNRSYAYSNDLISLLPQQPKKSSNQKSRKRKKRPRK
jgi:very-short-patch-repair endonuclease